MPGKDREREEPSSEEEVPEGGEVEKEETGEGQESTLAQELEDVRQQLSECQDRLLRSAAEFENIKKRLQRDRETSLKYAEENVLKELLPGIDNIERVMEQGIETKNIESLLEGVELTMKGLLGTLDKFGVKPIESLGEDFDPNLHEAIGMEPSGEFPANKVLNEFQKGYSYKERLLRAAKVIVSSGPSEGGEDDA